MTESQEFFISGTAEVSETLTIAEDKVDPDNRRINLSMAIIN